MTSFEKVAGKTKKEINIVIGLVVGTFQNWYPVAVMEKWGKGGRGEEINNIFYRLLTTLLIIK